MNDNAQLINQATDETLKEQIETEGLADAFVVTALKNILAKIKTTSAPQTSGQASDSGRHHVTHRPSTSTAWTRAAFAAIVLLLSLAAPVAAGPLEDATAAYDRGDYATALRLLRPLADQGDAIAQFNLGLMYDQGQGVPQNYAEAREVVSPRRRPGRRRRADQSRPHVPQWPGGAAELRRGAEVVSPRRRPRRRHCAGQSRRHVPGRGCRRTTPRPEVVSPRCRSRRRRAQFNLGLMYAMAEGCRRTTPRP